MEKHKRFLVFGYDRFYPAGGTSQIVKSFDTFEEAEIYIETKSVYDHHDVYDRFEGYSIFES